MLFLVFFKGQCDRLALASTCEVLSSCIVDTTTRIPKMFNSIVNIVNVIWNYFSFHCIQIKKKNVPTFPEIRLYSHGETSQHPNQHPFPPGKMGGRRLQVWEEFEREQSGASSLMLRLIVGLSHRLASAWLLSTQPPVSEHSTVYSAAWPGSAPITIAPLT